MARNANPFILKLMRFLPTAEIICLAAVFICVVMYRYGIEGGEGFLMISLQSLAAVFFLSAYVPLPIPQNNEDSKMGFKELMVYTVAPKVMGIASAVTTMGILFYLFHYEGVREMLFIGASALASGCMVLGFSIVTGIKYVNAVMPFLYRAVPLFLIAVYILVQL